MGIHCKKTRLKAANLFHSSVVFSEAVTLLVETKPVHTLYTLHTSRLPTYSTPWWYSLKQLRSLLRQSQTPHFTHFTYDSVVFFPD